MKKTFILSLLLGLLTVAAKAVPADPTPFKALQPDGRTVTVCLHGDEYIHFTTTADGYTVLRNPQGHYVYAEQRDGQLAPSDMLAHDDADRPLAERLFLSDKEKMLMPPMARYQQKERQEEYSRRAKVRRVRRAVEAGPENFRGLIILVQFNDRKFIRNDYVTFINNMVNQKGYKGYDDSDYGVFTGSVHDYFADNSFGQFLPQFDVVGPVTIDNSQYDAEKMKNAHIFTTKALAAADELVDYSVYDSNGDGWVDMVYFIFAGFGSNIGGNDERLVWPHAGAIYDRDNDSWVGHDDVWFYRYACSTELYGSPSYFIPDGIGTICHEFSHVLGLPDLYDTDYEDGGGQSADPGEWSVMAGGSYQNYGRTPVGYGIYERYAVGFTTPKNIDAEGSYTLSSIASSNTGYRMNTRVKNEFFLIENRQRSDKWDRYLPGHGMLVYRVDSTISRVWEQNRVNCNPRHNYFELLRANGGTENNATNPFPGTANITQLSNTTPGANLLSWSGLASPWAFINIKERREVISFDVIDVNVVLSVALPQEMTVALGSKTTLKPTCFPDYVPHTDTWTSSNEEVATIDKNGVVTARSVGQTTITVKVNDNDDLTAQCLLTVIEIPLAQTIAEFKQMPKHTLACLSLNEAEVLMAHGDNVYLRDATGAIVLPASMLGVATNDVLSANINAQFAVVDKMPWLQSWPDASAPIVEVTGSREPSPLVVSMSELSDRHYADLVTLHGVRLQSVTGDLPGLYAYSGDRSVRLRNYFDVPRITDPKNKNKLFDVTGILLTLNNDGQLIDELSLFSTPKAIGNIEESGIDGTQMGADDTVDIFTADGRRVASAPYGQLSRLPLRHGLYIVRSAKGSRTVVL